MAEPFRQPPRSDKSSDDRDSLRPIRHRVRTCPREPTGSATGDVARCGRVGCEEVASKCELGVSLSAKHAPLTIGARGRCERRLPTAGQASGEQHLGPVLVAGRLRERAQRRKHFPRPIHLAKGSHEIAGQQKGVPQVVLVHRCLSRETGLAQKVDGCCEVPLRGRHLVALQVQVAAVAVSAAEELR
ncbi:hypothetical protein [Nocardioides pyridinolyticus]